MTNATINGTHHQASSAERGPNPFRLGVFTRLVDQVSPSEVYARGLSLFEKAESLGFDTGWVAQHHAHKDGGLPAPLVFLAAAAARTTDLRLATGIITLPLENPLRLAEDAAVLDVLSNGRLELGFGTGGGDVIFGMFGRAVDKRQADYQQAFGVVQRALAGQQLTPGGPVLFPPAERLSKKLWEATFSVAGAIRAAEHGSGLLLARTTMPSPTSGGDTGDSHLPLGELQAPLVDAYFERWTSTDATPRLGLSRSIYVAETRAEALADAQAGMRRYGQVLAQRNNLSRVPTPEELLASAHVHIGGPDDVIASLRADRLLAVATDLILQVHPVDPSHEKTLRSLELIASEVAPALGWRATHHQQELDQAVAGGRTR